MQKGKSQKSFSGELAYTNLQLPPEFNIELYKSLQADLTLQVVCILVNKESRCPTTQSSTVNDPKSCAIYVNAVIGNVECKDIAKRFRGRNNSLYSVHSFQDLSIAINGQLFVEFEIWFNYLQMVILHLESTIQICF